MGYEREHKELVEKLWLRLSPEVASACEEEIVRLGPEALKLALTFPEPLLFPPTRRWLARLALRMPQKDVMPVLLEALAHPDWRIYQVARDAISKMGTDARDALVENLETCPSKDGRIQTLYCLHHLADPFGPQAVGDESLIAPIAKVAASDESADVRAYAITVLSRSEASEAADVIAAALDDTSEAVRLAAVAASARLGLKEAISALISMLSHTESEVRADVVRALDRIGDVSAAAVVRERLTDDNWYVRWAAVGALENLWEDDNAAALEAAADDENTVVAVAAREVLDRRG